MDEEEDVSNYYMTLRKVEGSRSWKIKRWIALYRELTFEKGYGPV
jgi:hypothetical protein